MADYFAIRGNLAPTVQVDVVSQTTVTTLSVRLTSRMFLLDLQQEVVKLLADKRTPMAAWPADGMDAISYYELQKKSQLSFELSIEIAGIR